MLSGTYRPGQIVVAVPTLSGPPQHKSQIPVASSTTQDEGLSNSIDGVDARSFLEAVLQILHTSNNAFRYKLIVKIDYLGVFFKMLLKTFLHVIENLITQVLCICLAALPFVSYK